ncbi:MAG: hypothetical protein JXA49_03240 [Actinobacteria bacterium]|nr:hypothetical protein [Actinomycetota bacterium]
MRELSKLIYLAGKANLRESIYDVMFPGPVEHKLETIENLLGSWSWFHLSTFLVAESGGKITACASGHNMAESGGPRLKDALTEIGWSPRDSWEIVARMAPLLRVEPDHSGNAWVIQNTGSIEDIKKGGPIEPLLTAMTEKGKESKATVAEFTFFTGNQAFQEIAEGLGFKVQDRTMDGAFRKHYGSPGMTMMTLPL